MMDGADLETLRKRMEEELARCREDIERLEVSASPIAPSNALGRLTRMDSMNDQGIAKASLNSNREKLYRLEKQARKLTPEERHAYRGRHARPISYLDIHVSCFLFGFLLGHPQ